MVERASNDQLLVAAAQTGSVQAFTLLVERHHAAVLRYIARLVGDRELAADLVQETFLDAFRHLDRMRDDRSFAAWLYTIARNHVLMSWRRQRLRRFVSLDWLAAGIGAVLPALRVPESNEACLEGDLIQQVLDDLKPSLREALLLHSLWGFSSQEVAQILGISLVAARKRIGRAKEQFRAEYAARTGATDD